MTPRVLTEPARLAGSPVLRCQTDERLVDLVRAGNDRAFEAIVDRYRRPLLRYCARLLPPARAEDAVQQAFLNAFAGLRACERRIELRPWLYRVAHNAALNALRENGWSHESIDGAVHALGAESAHEAAERRARLHSVLAAVQDLPERQRDAMVLRELEGRSYEQIAVAMDATGGAVRQLLNRARHTLRAAATALTPTGLLTRLPAGGGPALERASEALSNDALRGGAARAGAALAATLALAAGISQAPERLSPRAPQPPAAAATPDAARPAAPASAAWRGPDATRATAHGVPRLASPHPPPLSATAPPAAVAASAEPPPMSPAAPPAAPASPPRSGETLLASAARPTAPAREARIVRPQRHAHGSRGDRHRGARRERGSSRRGRGGRAGGDRGGRGEARRARGAPAGRGGSEHGAAAAAQAAERRFGERTRKAGRAERGPHPRAPRGGGNADGAAGGGTGPGGGRADGHPGRGPRHG